MCARALKIVSTDRILRFTNSLIIIIKIQLLTWLSKTFCVLATYTDRITPKLFCVTVAHTFGSNAVNEIHQGETNYINIKHYIKSV